MLEILVPLRKNVCIFVKNVLIFLKNVCGVPKSILNWGNALNHFLRVPKEIYKS